MPGMPASTPAKPGGFIPKETPRRSHFSGEKLLAINRKMSKYNWAINVNAKRIAEFERITRLFIGVKLSRRALRDILIDAANTYVMYASRALESGGKATKANWRWNWEPLGRIKGRRDRPLYYTGLMSSSFRVFIHDTGSGPIWTVGGIPWNIKYPTGSNYRSVGKIAEIQDRGYDIRVTPGVIKKFTTPPPKGYGVAAPRKATLTVPGREIKAPAIEMTVRKLNKKFIRAAHILMGFFEQGGVIFPY